MASVEADRVVIALIGDTSRLDGPVNQSSRQFERNMTTIEQSATRAERQIVKSSGQIVAANRNVARQLQDIGVQAGSGQSFPIIFLQQLPQLADALQDTESRFAGLARTLSSTWVQGGVAAIAIAYSVYQAIGKQADGVDALVEKMRSQSRQSELNDRASQIYKTTAEGVSQALREQRKVLDQLEGAEKTQVERINESAKAEVARATAIRRTTAALLSQAIAEQEVLKIRSQGPGQRGENATLGLDVATQRVEALRRQQAANDAAVAEAEKQYNESRGRLAVEQANKAAEAASTVEGKIQSRYDKQKKALEDRYRLEIQTTKEQAKQVQLANQLAAALNGLAQNRDRALKRAREKTSSDGDTVPFLRPVQGGTIRGTVGEKRPGHIHGGVDIAVPVGTSVSAAAAGTIVEAGVLPGYGNVIFIDHGRGTTTRYAHLSKLLGAKGDTVAAGDVIGLSGGVRGAPGSGNSRGAHLHYEVRRNGRPVDPNAGAFPIDPATASKVRDKVKDDFDNLFDDLQRDSQTATAKITSDFEALEGAIDPAAKIASDLEDTLGKIENARLIGIVGDARAMELQIKATHKAAADLLGDAIHIDDLRAGGEFERRELDDAEDKRKQAEDKAQDQRRDNIYQLADLYETLFTGGTANLWEEFKRQGLRALAILAAQATLRLLSGQSVGVGGGGEGDLLKIAAQAFTGRASGGYVGPGSIHRVNEHAGGVELLRMGPQGGTVIPLGQTRAANRGGSGGGNTYQISVSADHSVTPAGFASELAGRILSEARRMDSQAAQATLRAVPARLSGYQNDGT